MLIKCINKFLKINFLWRSNEEIRKDQYMKWEEVCMPITNGGLEIKKFVETKQALLGKWSWGYAVNSKGQWKSIIRQKYDNIHGD